MGNGDYSRWLRNLLCFLSPLLCLGGEEPRRVPEYELKAAFLYSIANFVEWPQNTFASSKDPIRICVLGKDPFGGKLDAVVEGKEIGGHPVTSEDVTNAQQALRCNILFVSSSERLHPNAVLDQVRSASVLTVGETPGFAEQAGIVNLKREGESVRIEVNITAAENAKLRISSKLLSLARILK